MRKFLLILTAGIITLGAASTAAQAEWVDHRFPVIYRAPVYVAPALRPVVYTAPVVTPPVYDQVVYTAPLYPAPVYGPVFQVHYDRYHHWHEWAERHGW